MRSFFEELRRLKDSGCDDLEENLEQATKKTLAKRRSNSAPSSASKKTKASSDIFASFKEKAIAMLRKDEPFQVPMGVLTIDAVPSDSHQIADQTPPGNGAATDDDAASSQSNPLSSLLTIYSNLETIDSTMGRVKVVNNYLRAIIFVLIQGRLIDQRAAAAKDGGAAFKRPKQRQIAAAFQKMCQSMLDEMPVDSATGQLQKVQSACIRATETSVASLQRQVSDYLRFYEVIQKYPALLFVIPSYHGFSGRLRSEFEAGDSTLKALHADLYKQLEERKVESRALLDSLQRKIVDHISLTAVNLGE